MNFKIEVDIGGRVVKDRFTGETLEDLHQYIKKKYPKGKLISAIGGG